MRHSSFAIGLLSVAAMLGPLSASAENISAAAISPYVRDTLTRSEKGIATAWARAEDMKLIEDSALGQWQRAVFSIVARVVDTQTSIAVQQKSLVSITACQRLDTLLLELEMEKVRTNLQDALDQQSISAINTLESVLNFINTRYVQLTRGANDPRFADTAWYTPQGFEDAPTKVWCCQKDQGDAMCHQMTSELCQGDGGVALSTLESCGNYGCKIDDGKATEPQRCPFASDYLPPSTSGYGCDANTLQSALDVLESSDFAKQAKTFIASARREQESIDTIQTILDSTDALRNGGDTEHAHYAAAGCFIDTVCAQNPEKTCTRDADCGNEDRCVDPLAVPKCSNKTGKCASLLDAVRTPLRGPFSFTPDDSALLDAFQFQRQAEGLRRPTAGYFTQMENPGLLGRALATYGQEIFRSINGAAGRQEAAIFAEGSDPMLQTGNIYDRLNKSVANIGIYASKMTGIRGFVRDFAWFLRRTCIDRPCNQRLERILKIVFADECFPYTTGDYASDSKDNPRWQKCMDAAQVQALE